MLEKTIKIDCQIITKLVNHCGCTHTHTHTFSLIDCKNININKLQIGSQYFCEPYLAIIK